MRVARVEVENFRSLEAATIEFDRLTAIVGRNGAGKSTALNALSVFYNLSAHVSEFDYFDCDTKRQIKIRVTFSHLSEREREEFASYESGDRLTVTKVISTGGSVYRGVRLQITEFAKLRGMPFREAQGELRQLIASARLPGLSGAPRSQSELNALLDSFESANRGLMQPIESESQFLGPTNVGGGKLDNHTRFVRVPAVRDAADEVDRKGAILQLIDVLVLRSVNARPEVRALNEELEAKLKEIFSRQNMPELDAIAQGVTKLLQRYAPGTALELDFGAIQAPKVPTPQPLASLIEDQFRCPIGHSGHGLQRALIFALLERLACTEAAMERGQSRSPAGDKTEQSSQTDDAAPDLILAIEEPELFLHPSRGRYLARTLRDLALANGSSSTQVCYTTHSPFFVGLDRFDQIRLARKNEADGTKTKRTVYSAYSRQSASADLLRIVRDVKSDFTEQSFVVRAAPIMTSVVNEGFFADTVVVVEGLSDVAAFTTIQELMGESWDEKGVVVVPAVGKASIDRPVIVFRGFRIPTYFVFDGDADAAPSDREQVARLNRHLLRLVDAPEEDFPKTQVNELWATFNVNIEEEFRQVDPEFFASERAQLAREFGFAKPAQALKNPETTALYVRRAHEKDKLPPVLIEIVRKISSLAVNIARVGL